MVYMMAHDYPDDNDNTPTPKNMKEKVFYSDIHCTLSSLFLFENVHCGYLLERPQGGSSNEYPQCMFLRINKKDNI